MAPIRVMRIIARMNVGGPAVEIVELMRGLPPEQFDQRLVTGFCGTDEADFLETQAPDVEAERVDGLGRSIRAGADARAFVALMRQIRDFDPHVVHTHTAKAGLLGRVAVKASRSRARIVHTHHGHLLHGYFGSTTTKAVVQTERVLSRMTDRLVTVGAAVRDDLLAAGIGRPSQYEVIYSGVRLGPIPPRHHSRLELGLPPDRPVISMIGRLTRIKRPDRFLDMVRTMALRVPEAHFAVAGWGDQGPEMAAAVMAEGLPVTMLGWRDDLERVLAATDIVVLSSDNEGTPLSLVQAALAGVPCVATRVGSVPEVVQHEVTGLLVPPDAQALADAAMTLISSPSAATRLGEEARNFALQRFSLSTFLEAHEELYRGKPS